MKINEFKKALQGNLEAKEVDVSAKTTEDIYNAFLDTIKQGLKEDGVVELFNFGKYEVRDRAARKGRNPQSGEEIDIAASKSVGFKTLKGLKDFAKAL